MCNHDHAPVRSVSGYQRDVLQALADGWTLEVLAYRNYSEYTLTKDGDADMLLNSEGTFFSLRRYLKWLGTRDGIARYTLNDAGRDVLSSAAQS